MERAEAAEHLDADPGRCRGPRCRGRAARRRRWSAALTMMALVPETSTPASKPSAGDGDRLGDGHAAEAARIEDVDLAAGGGLRDGAREGLAGRGAAARVGVVADARDPGPGRLGERQSSRRPRQNARASRRVMWMRVLTGHSS